MRTLTHAAAVPFALLLTAASPSAGESVLKEDEREAFTAELARMDETLGRFGPRTRGVDVAALAEAARWSLELDEFPDRKSVGHVKTVLAEGLRRAETLGDEAETRPRAGFTTGLGYLSDVDGTVQPMAVTLPATFYSDNRLADDRTHRRRPLWVVLHGRTGNLTPAKFLAGLDGKPAEEDLDHVELHVYGRGNVAYRWAGETDVFEAIAAAQSRFHTDPDRVVPWGFSMGGAGAWHLALHHPTRWAAAGAGAGFVDYHGYQNKPDPLPDVRERTLRIYDSVNYAANLGLLPFVTYGGDRDKQLLAGRTMQAAAGREGVPVKLIVGKDAGHKFTPEARGEFMDFLMENSKFGRFEHPEEWPVRFVTYTPKYGVVLDAPSLFSPGRLRVLELERMYERAEVQVRANPAGRMTIETENVSAFSVAPSEVGLIGFEVDGQRVDFGAWADRYRFTNGTGPLVFRRNGPVWTLGGDDARPAFPPRKRSGLQGPIDDAFMGGLPPEVHGTDGFHSPVPVTLGGFVAVTGDGEPWSQAHERFGTRTLDTFAENFRRYLNGDVRRISAAAVDEYRAEAVNDYHRFDHLVLFGDPGSNPLIAKVLPGLPVEWDRDGFTIAGTKYDHDTHALRMIYPNPLNPEKYVVLNSGHTFGEDAFRGTNALLYPRLGDAAVVKFTPDGDGGYTEEVVWSAIFDSDWALHD